MIDSWNSETKKRVRFIKDDSRAEVEKNMKNVNLQIEMVDD